MPRWDCRFFRQYDDLVHIFRRRNFRPHWKWQRKHQRNIRYSNVCTEFGNIRRPAILPGPFGYKSCDAKWDLRFSLSGGYLYANGGSEFWRQHERSEEHTSELQ